MFSIFDIMFYVGFKVLAGAMVPFMVRHHDAPAHHGGVVGSVEVQRYFS